jgi:serine protease Do
MIAQTPPGTRISLRLLRGQPGHKPAEQTLTAKLGELPAEALASAGGEPATPKPRSQSNLDALEGVEVTDLDARWRRQFDIPANIRGALVLNVQQDSNAAEAGLRPGEVILEIDRHPVTNADAAVQMSEQAKGDQILLRVWSPPSGGAPGATRFLVVDNIKHK